jgi:cytochrome c5
MRLTLTTLAVCLTLAACAHHEDSARPDPVANGPINGEAAYVEHCAACHETGMLGAPREGSPEDWEQRSKLWQAVLMEHAKTGYFEMPARGGNTQLPDEIVNAAAEYMLEKTFPNRPED